MAREDIIPQLLRQLMLKEGPPEESDNSILQKMIVPYDQATLSDSMTISRVPSSSFVWGLFNWSMGQWGSVQEKMIAPQDTATVSDAIKVTKILDGNSPWGYFGWSMNEWWIPGTKQNWSYYQNTTWSNFGNGSWSGM